MTRSGKSLTLYRLRQYAVKGGMYVVLMTLSLIALSPMYYAAINAFKTNEEYVENRFGLPQTWTTVNFRYVYSIANLSRYLMNNLIVIPLGLTLYLLVCCSAGFAFGLLRFRWKHLIFGLVLFFMIFPPMLLAVPIYLICGKLHLISTRLGIILVWVAYFAPYGTYIMSTFFASVPRELIESSRIDGANVLQMLVWVMMPVAKPMLATVSIIGFLSMWNELPFSMLLLQKNAVRTFVLGIAMLKGEYGVTDPILSASVVLGCLIPLAVFLFFQRYVTGGALAGSVKG
jgi:ABC-type glycerol-3-phosphate transport system permease component